MTISKNSIVAQKTSPGGGSTPVPLLILTDITTAKDSSTVIREENQPGVSKNSTTVSCGTLGRMTSGSP